MHVLNAKVSHWNFLNSIALKQFKEAIKFYNIAATGFFVVVVEKNERKNDFTLTRDDVFLKSTVCKNVLVFYEGQNWLSNWEISFYEQYRMN